MLVDTHCHLDLLESPSKRILAAAEEGVAHFIVPGVNPLGWPEIMFLSGDSRIHAAPGIHPAYSDRWCKVADNDLCSLLQESVAVGEIGLDYTKGMPDRELQEKVFRCQLHIARNLGLPVIIHCRNAFGDTLRILKEERIGDFGGVMHAFSGSMETARQAVDMGLKIGIAGSVTWPEARKPAGVASMLRLQDMLLETDAPDMAPQSRRGGSNEPALLVEIAERVAMLQKLPVAQVAEITTQNAIELFPRLNKN